MMSIPTMQAAASRTRRATPKRTELSKSNARANTDAGVRSAATERDATRRRPRFLTLRRKDSVLHRGFSAKAGDEGWRASACDDLLPRGTYIAARRLGVFPTAPRGRARSGHLKASSHQPGTHFQRGAAPGALENQP